MSRWIPTVVEALDQGERSCDIYSRLLSDRIVFLGEEVSDAAASVITAQLLYLESLDPERDICLYINSPGGSVSAGLAIYDVMRYIRCDISTVCVGMAASMGAFLLAGGTRGKRLALPHSQILIHQAAIHGNGLQGQVSDIAIVAEHLKSSKERLNQILAQNTGRSPEEILRDTDRDHYMTAEEAREYGLIDRVLSERKE